MLDSLGKPEASAELKKMTKDIMSAVDTVVDALKDDNRDTLQKASAYLEKYEALNADLVKAHKLYEKRIEHLELRLATEAKAALDPDAARRDTPEYKAWFKFATSGQGKLALTPEEVKTLRTDAESAGGYLIPQVMDNVIRKNIIEISPIRAHARNRVAVSKTMDIPKRLSIPIAQFEGEAETAPVDQSIYGSEQITLYRQTVQIPATLDMMVSSAFDLEREIASDVGESFAQGEARNFVLGNGRKCPHGIIMDTRCVGFTSNATQLVWDDFANMAGKLKRGQSPWYFMNRRTLAYCQTLKSSIGVPIWMPVAGNQPATIFGYPYDSNVIDLDDVGSSGAKPIIFGDLSRGYEIFDMIGINVIRDDITQAGAAITKWIFRRYLTGRVIMPESIAIMTLA